MFNSSSTCLTVIGELTQSPFALSCGFRIIPTARRVGTLMALKEKGAEILELDVTSPPSENSAFVASAWAI
jgi:hypothetical protein